MYMKLNIKNFNLKDTITCGQIFRFEEESDNSYTVLLPDRVINIKQDKDEITIDSNKLDNLENVVKNYFDLNYDYESINNMLIKTNPELENIINYSKGLKIINEPKEEVIISYILSSNNKVSQIKNALDNISNAYGEEVIFNNKKYYLFPKLDKLMNVSISRFRELKTGFRDKYLYNFIHSNFDINKINSMSSEESLEYLKTNPGIGDKVASCILLFGFHRFDVFPIDTWVKKYMNDEYNITDIKKIKQFTKDKYREYSGLVIQYMFNYKRNKK